MPKLNIRNAGLVSGGGVNAQASPDAFGAGIGASIAQLGNALSAIDKKNQAKIDDNKRNEATNLISKSRIDKVDFIQRARIDNPDITAEDIKKISTDFDTAAIESAPIDNKFITNSLARNLNEIGAKEIFKAHATDAKRNLEGQLLIIQDSLNTANNIVETDPSRLQEMLDATTGMVEHSTLLNDNAKQQQIAASKASLVSSSFATRLNKNGDNYDPKGVLADLNSGDFDKIIDSKSKAEFLASASLKSDDQSFTESVSRVQSDFPDTRARYEYLTTTNAAEIEKVYGLNAGGSSRLAGDTRQQLTYERGEKARLIEATKVDANSKLADIVESDGNVAAIDYIKKNDEAYPSLAEKNIAINSVRNFNSNDFDHAKYQEMQRQIMSGEFINESSIDLEGMPAQQSKVLHSMWADWKKNYGDTNFFKSSAKVFRDFKKENDFIKITEPQFMARVLSQIRKKGISPYDDEVNDIVDKLLSKVEGSGKISNLFNDKPLFDKFGIELPPKDVPIIKTLEEAMALPKGTEYIDVNGGRHVRP